MAKILVTGGMGFVGSHIVDALIENHEVVVIGRNTLARHHHTHENAIYEWLDIRGKELLPVFQRHEPDYVIHLAAQVDVAESVNYPSMDADLNVNGTINVLEACRLTGVKKILFASTAAVYGQPQYLGIDENHPISPMAPYGLSKYVAERYIALYHKLYDLPYTILRLANVYGPRQTVKSDGAVVSTLIDLYLRGKAPTIHGTGQQTRDFIYVADVVSIFERCLTRGDGEVFNVGKGHQTTINELVNLLNGTFEIHTEPLYTPPRLGDIDHSYFDISKLMTVLDWQPEYSLEDGLVDTVHYYRRSLRM